MYRQYEDPWKLQNETMKVKEMLERRMLELREEIKIYVDFELPPGCMWECCLGCQNIECDGQKIEAMETEYKIAVDELITIEAVKYDLTWHEARYGFRFACENIRLAERYFPDIYPLNQHWPDIFPFNA